MIPGASPGARGARCRSRRPCDDGRDAPARATIRARRRPLRPALASLVAARLAPAPAGRSPTARSRPSRRRSATCSSAGRSSRCRRCALAVALGCVDLGGPAGRRGASRATRCPRRRTRGLRAGWRRSRSRCCRDRALRHDAVLGPHGPAPPADARRRAAPRPRRRRSRCSCASPRRERRRRWILPVLHSRVAAGPGLPGRGLARSSPAVMWASHFSPLFDVALEDPLVHDLEHVLFLGAALLFWWPAVGLDPARGGCPTRPRSCTSSCRCPRTRSSRS